MIEEIDSVEKLEIILHKMLLEKNFSEKAKNCLIKTLKLIYECYRPPEYVAISKQQYISEYLDVIRNMNHFGIIELEDLNLSLRETEFIKRGIVEAEGGNLEFVNGKYIKSTNGSYCSNRKGFALQKEQEMYALNEGDEFMLLTTVHHEMTHLRQGINGFTINSELPFAYEIRQLLLGGQAATNESYLNLKEVNDSYNMAKIVDETCKVETASVTSYPLYKYLYEMLQFIFGVEELEKLSKNVENEEDVIAVLKNRFPSIPVETLFAHIIYILKCYKNVSREVLENAIQIYSDFKIIEERRDFSIEQHFSIINNNIISKEKDIQFWENQEKDLVQLLNNPQTLKEVYEKELNVLLEELEESFKAGEISLEEYNQAKEQGSFEDYREMKEFELRNIKEGINNRRVELSDLKLQLKNILKDKEKKVNLVPVLEEICIKNSSLKNSFQFLEDFVFRKLYYDAGQLSHEDRNNELVSCLDKINQFLQLNEYIFIHDNEKKATF